MWKVGIIGAGSYGEMHAKAIANTDGVELVAASRTNAGALAEFTGQYGGRGYTDYADLLADPNVNTVVIATPHHHHTEIAVKAAQAGKHILLEKPMAPTLAECRQIAEAAEAAGIQLMLGHVNHFAHPYRIARQILESGEMGEVIQGSAAMQKYWMEGNRREWHMNRETGGGVWMTVGVHPLDRLVWLTDSPVTSVAAQFGTRFYEQQADDVGMVFLRFANGAAGCVVSTGYSDGAPKHLTELTCTRGMMNIDYNAGVLIGRQDKWQLVPDSQPTGDWMLEALTDEWRGFVGALNSGSRPPVPADFALHIMDIIFAAEQSSREKREIPLTSSWQS